MYEIIKCVACEKIYISSLLLIYHSESNKIFNRNCTVRCGIEKLQGRRSGEIARLFRVETFTRHAVDFPN